MRAVGNDWDLQSWAVTWLSCVLERSFWWICRAWAETRVVKGPVTGDWWASSGLEQDENHSLDGGYFSQFRLLQTGYHRQGGLSNRNLFITPLEAEESKIRVLADSTSSENSLFGLLTATFLLPPLKTEGGRDRERDHLWCFSACKGTNAIHEGPILSLITCQTPHLQTSSHWGWGFNIWIWRDTNIPLGFPGGANGKEPVCQCRKYKRHGFNP